MKKIGRLFFIILALAVFCMTFAACGDDSEEIIDNIGGGSSTVTETTYSVSFDSTGGSTVSGSTGLNIGDKVDEPAVPIREDYKFVGWYTDVAGTGSAVTFPYVVTGNATLYAVWEKGSMDTTYIESFLSKNFDDPVNAYYRKTYDINISEYDFSGFKSVAEFSGCVLGIYYSDDYSSENLAYVSNSTTWLQLEGAGSVSNLKTSSVFSLNKGNNYFYLWFRANDWSVSQKYQINIRRGNSYTVTFYGNNNDTLELEVPFEGTVYNEFDTLTPAYSKYCRTYTQNVIDESGNVTDVIYVWDGKLYPCSDISDYEVRTGYDFNYWYVYSNNQNIDMVSITEEGYSINSDLFLFSAWTPKTTKVTLSSVGCDKLETATYSIAYNNGAYKFNVPQKMQAVFLGWYYEPAAGAAVKVTKSDGTSVGVWNIDLAEVTLVARWKMNTYELRIYNSDPNAGTDLAAGTISVEVNGSAAENNLSNESNPENLAMMFTFDYGEVFTLTATANPGYRFLGWTEQENSTSYYNPSNPTAPYTAAMPSRRLIFWAKWEAIPYTLTFSDLDGGKLYETTTTQVSGVETNIDTELTDNNIALYINNSRSYSRKAFKTGYTFAGWYYLNANNEYESIECQLIYDGAGNVVDCKISSDTLVSLMIEKGITSIDLVAKYNINYYSFNISEDITLPTKTDVNVRVQYVDEEGTSVDKTYSSLADFRAAVQSGEVYQYNTTVIVSAINRNALDIVMFTGWYLVNIDGSSTLLVQDTLSEGKYLDNPVPVGEAKKIYSFKITDDTLLKPAFETVKRKVILDTSDGRDYSQCIDNEGRLIVYDADGNEITQEGIKYGSVGFYSEVPASIKGYIFMGFVDSARNIYLFDGTGSSHEAFTSTGSNGDITVYPVWEAQTYDNTTISSHIEKIAGTVSAAGGKVVVRVDGKELEGADAFTFSYNSDVNLNVSVSSGYVFDKVVKQYWNGSIVVSTTEYAVANLGTYGNAFVYDADNRCYVVSMCLEDDLGDTNTPGRVTFDVYWQAKTYDIDVNRVSTSNDSKTKYIAEFGSNLLYYHIDPANPDSDIVSTRELNVDQLNQYQFLYWKYIFNGEEIIVSDEYGSYDHVWEIDGSVEISAKWKSIFEYDPENNTITGITDYGRLNYSDELVIPGEIDGISMTAIGGGAFKNWITLSSVTISKEIVTVGANAFEGCSGITTLNIGTDENGSRISRVEKIGDYAFLNCIGITSLVIPRVVTTFGRGVLKGCVNIETLTYTGNVAVGLLFGTESYGTVGGSSPTAAAVVQNDTQYYIPTKLTKVCFTSGISTISDYVLAGMTQVTAVEIPTSVTTIGESAFAESGLTSLTIPQNVSIIGINAFRGTDIDTITIPASVTEIGLGAFADNTQLTTVTFNNIITEVPMAIFYGCTGLTTVSGLDNVVKVEADAFCDCSALSLFAGSSTVEYIGDNAFYNSNITPNETWNKVTYIGYNAFSNLTADNVIIGSVYYKYNSGTVDFGTATYIAERAFAGSSISSVTIGSSIVEIGISAFEGCTDLTSLSFEANSSLRVIGGRAFYNTKLAGIVNIPDTLSQLGPEVFAKDFEKITSGGIFYGMSDLTIAFTGNSSLRVIGKAAFMYSNISSFDFPASVRSISEGAFEGSQLNSVTFAGEYKNAIIPARAFYGCTKLHGISVPKVVTSIGNYAFAESGLGQGNTTVSVAPNIDGAGTINGTNMTNVTDGVGISGTFVPGSVINLTAIPNANYAFSKWTVDGEAISEEESIEYTVLSKDTKIVAEFKEDYNGSKHKVTLIKTEPFAGTATTNAVGDEVENDASVTLKATTIEGYSFVGWGDKAYTDAEDCISNDAEYTFTVTASVKYFAVYSADDVTAAEAHSLYFEDSSKLATIGNYAFYNCQTLATIDTGKTAKTLPDSVKTIGVGAFERCSELTTLVATAVTEVSDRLFFDCESLVTVTLSANVVSFGSYAFYNCNNLIDITSIKNSEVVDGKFSSALKFIGDSAFENCVQLADQGITAELTSLSYIGSRAFYNCKQLIGVTLPASITAISSETFSGCIAMTYLDFSTNDGSGVQSIGVAAFYNCKSLNELVIPDTVLTVGDDSFNGCIGLIDITVGASVTRIGSRAFMGAAAKSVTFTGAVPPVLLSGAFDDTVTEYFVLDLYKSDYAAAVGWNGKNVVGYVI